MQIFVSGSLLAASVFGQSLSSTFVCFHSLLVAFIHFWSLSFTFVHFHSLLFTFSHVESLPLASVHFRSLLFAFVHFHLHPFTFIRFCLPCIHSLWVSLSPFYGTRSSFKVHNKLRGEERIDVYIHISGLHYNNVWGKWMSWQTICGGVVPSMQAMRMKIRKVNQSESKRDRRQFHFRSLLVALACIESRRLTFLRFKRRKVTLSRKSERLKWNC